MTRSDSTRDAALAAVTVTYGARRAYLQTLVARCLSSGIRNVVVVDNGASWDVASIARESAQARVQVVPLGANLGSAAGFAAGIEHALAMGMELVWLLDDDSLPRAATLPALLEAYRRLRADHDEGALAVLAFRAGHHPALTRRRGPRAPARLRRSSFRGFHVLDVPGRLLARTPASRPGTASDRDAVIPLEFAPYSGLLFHRSLVEAIGLPNRDLVLYGDDTEFTSRVVRAGGCLALVTSAPLDEQEPSWHTEPRYGGTLLSRLLLGDSDLRTYYMVRNGAYLDAHCLPHWGPMLWLNRMVYMSLLAMASVLRRRPARFRLIVRAVRDGVAGKLGIHDDYPL